MKAILFLLMSALIALGGCGKPKDSGESVPISEDPNAQAQSGPYIVNFSSTDNMYNHLFQGNINQNEGKIEYYIATPTSTQIEVRQSTLTVTGCSASKVKHYLYWVPDANFPNEGAPVKVGSLLQTLPNTKGVLRHVLLGLDGCQSIELLTSLKQIPQSTHIGSACDSTATNCQIKQYCREKNASSSFNEVEVWSQTWGLELRNFMNHGDGTRSLMMVTTARDTSDSSVYRYESTSATIANLALAKLTKQGVFSQVVVGTQVKLDLICD